MKRIYIAGPYSSDPEGNTARAIGVANVLMDRGYAVFVPHLSHYLQAAQERPYQWWIQHDLDWLACCDLLVRIHGESSGADREVARATHLGIPVYDWDVFKRLFA